MGIPRERRHRFAANDPRHQLPGLHQGAERAHARLQRGARRGLDAQVQREVRRTSRGAARRGGQGDPGTYLGGRTACNQKVRRTLWQ